MSISNLFSEPGNCCSCKACANVCPKNAISFLPDENGFTYPKINEELCIGCNKCVKVCQFNREIILNEPKKSIACVNKDNKILKQSTSGGIFSAIAESVLKRNGAVFGCAMNEDFYAQHICIESIDQLASLRGSKYLLSDIKMCYKDAKERLDNGQFVLFSGTPCQIAGLYCVLGKEYDNLLTIDLVCHGTPNYLMFKKYIEYLENKYKTKITYYNFRTKNRTWLRFGCAFGNTNKHFHINKFEEFYHTCFTSGHILQESCYSCQFATRKRVADFTLCDFWGFQISKIKIREEKGLSACMLNTEKALSYFDELSEKIKYEEVDYDIVVKGNGCLRKPTKRGNFRDYYMKAYREDKIDEAAEQYIQNRKKFIRRQKCLYILPYKFYKLFRFGINKKKNSI